MEILWDKIKEKFGELVLSSSLAFLTAGAPLWLPTAIETYGKYKQNKYIQKTFKEISYEDFSEMKNKGFVSEVSLQDYCKKAGKSPERYDSSLRVIDSLNDSPVLVPKGIEAVVEYACSEKGCYGVALVPRRK